MTEPDPRHAPSDASAPASAPSRRQVLLTGGVVAAAAAVTAACGSSAAAGGASSAGGSSPAASTPAGPASSSPSDVGGGSGTSVATADVPVGGGTILVDQKVVVTQPTAGQFKAFTAVCTHQGCLVASVANGVITCPCHGSTFSISDGSPQSGPASSPLASVGVTVSGDSITVA